MSGARTLTSAVIIVTGVLLATALPALAHHGEAPSPAATVTYLVAFLFGLLGEANCFGLCGPLVALYSTRFGGWPRVTTPAPAHPHLLFNAGRIVCYSGPRLPGRHAEAPAHHSSSPHGPDRVGGGHLRDPTARAASAGAWAAVHGC